MDDSLSYVIGDPLPGPLRTLWDQFEDSVKEYPETVALVATHQSASIYGLSSIALETEEYALSPYLRLSYRQLRNAVNRLARSLSAQGVQAGMPIFTFLPNGLEFITVFWASSELGCTLVPINIRNLANETEVAHLIQTAFKGCSSASAVLFTDSPDTAARLDRYTEFANALKIVSGDASWEHWTAFGSLLADAQLMDGCLPDIVADTDRNRCILFTSGTTGLPKGAYGSAAYLMATQPTLMAQGAAEGQVTASRVHGAVFASIMPNNHGMAMFFTYSALAFGGTLVFPGPYFEPVSFLGALRAERCTSIVLVPTMLYALLLAKSDAQSAEGNTNTAPMTLERAFLGGAAVSPEVVRLTHDELGAKCIENLYGLSEGFFTSSGPRLPEEICRGDRVTVGGCPAGARIKICEPNTRVPVPRGQPGELHASAPSVQTFYIRKTSSDEASPFYEEDGLPWVATGDQAVLDADGYMFIVGRYKEMIIRGGENIAPAAMEACINQKLPHFKHLQIQIVGAADEFAGEVPVAIVAKPVDSQTAKIIKETVTTNMGMMYAIDEVISLEQLGLDDFPRTLSAKIQKSKLVESVRKYRSQVEASSATPANSRLGEQVTQIWARLVGLEAADLSPSTELAALGDSITLMRVKDRLYKETGINLTVQEVLAAGTLGNLISVMQSRVPVNVDKALARFQLPDRPPSIDEMVHVVGDLDVFEATKRVISDAIKPHGLSWDDVRSVMPAYDFTDVKVRDGTLERLCFKIALLSRKHTVEELRAAFLTTLANNPMQSSFLVRDDDLLGDELTLQFTVDQKPQWLHGLIEDKGTLSTVASLRQRALDMCMLTLAEYPGPLARIHLFFIEETQCAGAIVNVHHAVNDASFFQLVTEDLDLALNGALLKPHVPYKLYCDNLYNLGNSPAARAATKYHVQKLKGLASHKAHIFPPLNRPLDLQDDKPDGYVHTFPAAAIQKLLQSQPHLAPSVVMKAAVVLFLRHQTGHTHALFGSWESGRDKFPFLDSATAAAAHLEASDVGGQVIQPVLNLVSFEDGETVMGFLTRMQADQALQTKHAAAPLRQIMRGLDEDAAAMFTQQLTYCIYNWLGSKALYAHIEVVDAVMRRDFDPFSLLASLVRDKAGDRFEIALRGSVWNVHELSVFALEVEATAQWLAQETNWQRPVTECEEAFPTL